MVPLFHFHLPYVYGHLSLSCVALCTLPPLILHSQHSSYILLDYYAMNTAWSVHQVSTYLNSTISHVSLNFDLDMLEPDRGKCRLKG